eukprot:244293-Chlamydomonas_euryale.AAC.1
MPAAARRVIRPSTATGASRRAAARAAAVRHPLARVGVEHRRRARLVDHAAAADGAAADVQPVANKDRAVLVAPHRHRAGRRVPLPAAVAVACKPIRIAERRAAGVAPATEEQQA